MAPSRTILCYLDLTWPDEPAPDLREATLALVARLREAGASSTVLVDEIEAPGPRSVAPERQPTVDRETLFFEPMLRPESSSPEVGDDGELHSKDESQFEDQPVRTFGVWLELSDAVSERRQLEATEQLIEGIRDLTARHPGVFEVEWHSELLGAIAAGKVDTQITAGWLDPWRARLRDRKDE